MAGRASLICSIMIVFYSYMAWDGGDWTAAGVFSGKFSIFDNSKLRGGFSFVSFNRKQMEQMKSGYAPVNGLQLYYEIDGAGDPLVYLGAGFAVAGVTRLTGLMKLRQVISVDMQGRGRTRT